MVRWYFARRILIFFPNSQLGGRQHPTRSPVAMAASEARRAPVASVRRPLITSPSNKPRRSSGPPERPFELERIDIWVCTSGQWRGGRAPPTSTSLSAVTFYNCCCSPAVEPSPPWIILRRKSAGIERWHNCFGFFFTMTPKSGERKSSYSTLPLRQIFFYLV